jgi:hypothetical protein
MSGFLERPATLLPPSSKSTKTALSDHFSRFPTRASSRVFQPFVDRASG